MRRYLLLVGVLTGLLGLAVITHPAIIDDALELLVPDEDDLPTEPVYTRID